MTYVARMQQHIQERPPEDGISVSKELKADNSAAPCKPFADMSLLASSDSNKQSIKHKRTKYGKKARKYNLDFGVFSISYSESDPLRKGRTEDATAKKLNFELIANGLLRRGFSLLCERSLGVWQYSLRPLSIFTTSDPIFDRCVSGDLLGAKQLCIEGKASPFDVTYGGFTLLHVSASLGNQPSILG